MLNWRTERVQTVLRTKLPQLTRYQPEQSFQNKEPINVISRAACLIHNGTILTLN